MSAWETSHDEFELALEPPKQQWRLADQADPWTTLEAVKMDTPPGAAFLADKAIDVLNDQAGRGQLLKHIAESASETRSELRSLQTSSEV